MMKINLSPKQVEELLARHGWVLIDSIEPEIRHSTENSFATGRAAAMVISLLAMGDSEHW